MKSFHLSIIAAALCFSSLGMAAPVNINTADASEIAQALRGIGLSKAQAIVQYRKQNGSFKKADDIIQVKGIGQATFEKNRSDILVK